MADWNKIKAEYIRGETYRSLADKYGVSFSTMSQVGSREKWTDLRKDYRNKFEKKVVETTANKSAKEAERIQTLTCGMLDRIERMMTEEQSATGMRALMSAIKDAKDVLGIKSDLDKAEQKARIEKLKHDVQPESQENKKIEVVISKDLIDYAG